MATVYIFSKFVVSCEDMAAYKGQSIRESYAAKIWCRLILKPKGYRILKGVVEEKQVPRLYRFPVLRNVSSIKKKTNFVVTDIRKMLFHIVQLSALMFDVEVLYRTAID